MSADTGRQDTTDKVINKVQPDETKKTSEIAGQKASGAGDSIASGVQSVTGTKSDSQKAADKTQSEGNSVLGSVSDTASNVASSVTDTAKGLTGNK